MMGPLRGNELRHLRRGGVLVRCSRKYPLLMMWLTP